MPRTRSLAWSELKVGLLSVTAIVIASVLIFLLSGDSGFFWQRYHLKTRFSNVATLKAGSPVRVAGVEVGSVTDVKFEGIQVDVWMELSKKVRDRVRTSSVASVGSVSLLGEGAVDITASLEGEPIQDWGYVRSVRSPGQLSDAIEQGTRSLEQATLLIQDIRKGKGTVGKLFTEDDVYRDIQGFVSAADQVAKTIAKGDGSLGRLVRDPTTARELEASLKNLTEITKRLSAGEGSLGQLLKDDKFSRTLTSATSNIDTVTGKMARGEGTAGKLVHDDALYNQLDSVTDRLDLLIGRLNQGEGTAGQFLQDKQLYDNLNKAATEIRGLVGDIRKDPRKYLRVKVSIF